MQSEGSKESFWAERPSLGKTDLDLCPVLMYTAYVSLYCVTATDFHCIGNKNITEKKKEKWAARHHTGLKKQRRLVRLFKPLYVDLKIKVLSSPCVGKLSQDVRRQLKQDVCVFKCDGCLPQTVWVIILLFTSIFSISSAKTIVAMTLS